MKPVLIAMVLLLTAGMVACGGSTTTSTLSGIKNRAFVTNTYSGVVQILDASTDALSTTTTIAVNSQPTIMAVTPDRTLTMVYNSGVNTVSVITNGSESVAGNISLPNAANNVTLTNGTKSMVAKDDSTGYAAIPNAFVAGQVGGGAVAVLDLKNFVVSSTIGVPRAHRLVLSHNGSKLLVFSDNSDSVTIIDTTSNTLQTVSGFDRPVSGVFSLDDSTAYVMNCGPECGSTQASASVQPLTIATGSAGTAVSVSGGATVGLLSSDGTQLYIAGTAGGTSANGTLTVLSVPALSIVSSFNISNGLHTLMALGSNNKLFIGSTACTDDPSIANTGCLSIFDTAANTATIDTASDPVTGNPKGFVTGMAAVPNRSVFYVVEGGVLRVFDTTSSSEVPGKVNVIGQAYDAKLVDE